MGSFEYRGVRSSTNAKKKFDDNFLIIMHLGVVKVGLLRLPKPDVISQRIILAKTKNLTLDNFSSNFDNP